MNISEITALQRELMVGSIEQRIKGGQTKQDPTTKPVITDEGIEDEASMQEPEPTTETQFD